ncbi:RDD family protein [Hydrogenimonas sp.]
MDETLERALKGSGLTLAPLGRRTVAYAIDETLVSFIFVAAFWDQIAAAQTPEAVAALVNGAWLPVAMTKIGYHTLFVWLYGASLGKMAMKMQVVETLTMVRPRFAVAFNRAIFRIVSEMVFYFGFLWAFFDPARQAWHDKTASTLVVDA